MNIRQALKGWRREDRGWPRYLPGGRIRTSTAGLLIAFIALFWLYQVYDPPARAPAPASAVVPPGFVPDPDYTWVPRTQVQEPTQRTTTTAPTTTAPTTTTPTTTTTPPPTSPTSPDTTSPTDPLGPTTTVIDPDGPGPLSPQTFTQAPPGPTPAAPVPPTTLPPQ